MTQKVTAGHLQRMACLYVRQSTLQQVMENCESTARQYALRQRAEALGWPHEQIVVIDEDLGYSGASAADRAGFQRLVAEVGLGKVGVVMGLEVSRLARSSRDWHQLLEICALTDTLILDEEGIYDPGTFNDRLLLGLKGTMSEAELYVLKARLQGGLLNKAKRGALKLHLPIGFRYAPDDQIILDPHQQVQASIHFLFQTFEQTGSASATVRVFREQKVAFPGRVRSGARRGELTWGALGHETVLRILHNPCYAGAYAFGRTRTRKDVDGRVRITRLPMDEWQVLIKDAHVGYIDWPTYERNLAQLGANRQAYTPERLSPPREGPALLQGIVICGVCGRRMTVRYRQRGANKKIDPDYLCQREGIERGEAPCQRIPGRDLDAALSRYLLSAITPETIDATLIIQDELTARAVEATRLRQLEVTRAQYEADLAQRRFMRVDPDNRLVAAVLEANWNDKLRALAEAREHAEQQREQDEHRLTSAERARLRETPDLFRRVWCDPSLTHRQRKRIVRLIVEDVTLTKDHEIRAALRFKGGSYHTLTVPSPRPFLESRTTLPATVQMIDELLEKYTDSETAHKLNEQGITSLEGIPFTAERVSALRRSHQLKSRFTRLREAGWHTVGEVAEHFGVTPPTIWRWYHRGLIVGIHYNDRTWRLFKIPAVRPKISRKRSSSNCK